MKKIRYSSTINLREYCESVVILYSSEKVRRFEFFAIILRLMFNVDTRL